MKKVVLALLLLLPMVSFGKKKADCPMAQDLNGLYKMEIPFDMPAYHLPSIPDYQVELSQFGGVGDGVTDNTKAFADAIAHLAQKGGGELLVKPGVWLTGPIEFISHFRLNVERGAVILFSTDHSLYPLLYTNYEGHEGYRCQSPLSAFQVEDVAIVGEGVIDGQGDSWRPVKKNKMTSGQWSRLLSSGGCTNANGDIWFPSEGARDGYMFASRRNTKDEAALESVKDFFRPVMLSFRYCKNVLLSGVSFQNSPAWCLHPFCCENVVLYNISVRNPWYSQNGDGLDLESCSNSIIYKCSFDVGDDAICIKSGRDEEGRRRGMPTQDALIVNNTVYHGHGGFTVGSEMSGGARRIYVKNCTFLGTDVGLRFKSNRGRGGVVEDIYIDGIQMLDIATEAFSFNLYYGGNSPVLEAGEKPDDIKMVAFPVTEATPVFRKIYVSNVTCNGAQQAMLFNGLPEMKISEIEVRNSTFTSQRGVRLAQVDGVLIENVSIKAAVGEPYETLDALNVTIR